MAFIEIWTYDKVLSIYQLWPKIKAVSKQTDHVSETSQRLISLPYKIRGEIFQNRGDFEVKKHARALSVRATLKSCIKIFIKNRIYLKQTCFNNTIEYRCIFINNMHYLGESKWRESGHKVRGRWDEGK